MLHTNNMKHYRGFTKYVHPEYVGENILFEKSECGTCWYDAHQSFSKDTMKIVYHPETRKVISFSKDASWLIPHGNHVIEIESAPEEMDFFNWYLDEDFVPFYKEPEKKIRSIAQIQKDLDKLQEELLAHKE